MIGVVNALDDVRSALDLADSEAEDMIAELEEVRDERDEALEKLAAIGKYLRGRNRLDPEDADLLSEIEAML